MSDRRFPLVTLVVLDGWGLAPPGPGNAVELASTPVFDGLWATYPHTSLAASGEAVGLPPGQMGNSEVGHLTIGSGRVLFQDLMRVNLAVRDGAIFVNPALVGAFERAGSAGWRRPPAGARLQGRRALAHRPPARTARAGGAAGDGGADVDPRVHRRPRRLAERGRGRPRPASRGTNRHDRRALLRDGPRQPRRANGAGGRRDLDGEGEAATDPVAAVAASYERGITDEFIEPIVFPACPRLDAAADAAIFFNFRPDRGRQLSRRLLERGVDLTTMTRYAEDIATPVAFPEQDVSETLAEVLSGAGIRQLHAAETEKYAHVTYFFNGGEETEWEGETRVLVPSPRDVPSYDLKPEMSAAGVAGAVTAALADGYGFCVVNFANPDMVGHTGVIPAVVRAVEAADAALGEVVRETALLGGVCLVTADHGNAEQMLEADGVSPHTAHTTNPVPLVVTAPGLGFAPMEASPTSLRRRSNCLESPFRRP